MVNSFYRDISKKYTTILQPKVKLFISKESGFSQKQLRFINRMNKEDLFLFVNIRNKNAEPNKYDYMNKRQLLNSLKYRV